VRIENVWPWCSRSTPLPIEGVSAATRVTVARDDRQERTSRLLSLSKSPGLGGDVRPLRLVLGPAAG
jgi:hypothetical protein